MDVFLRAASRISTRNLCIRTGMGKRSKRLIYFHLSTSLALASADDARLQIRTTKVAIGRRQAFVINKAAIRVSGIGSLCVASRPLKQVGLNDVGGNAAKSNMDRETGKRLGLRGFSALCRKVFRTVPHVR
jgi:hypothetical protein